MKYRPQVLLIATTGLNKKGQPITMNRTYLPGLSMPSLAAVTPDLVDVTVISETSEKIPYDKHWDLVGLTGMGGSGVTRGWQLGDEFRRRGSKVVMGGIAASLCNPGWTLEHADSLVIGEAEETWPLLIEDFVNGGLKDVYRMEKVPDINSIPAPAYEKLNWKKYGFWRPVQATRGCPFTCNFCSISQFFKRSYRKRPVAQVIRDVRKAKATGSRYIAFIDDNIGVDFNYCRELWEALIPEKIIWISQCSLQISENEDMLDLAYRSGCRILSFGIESVNKKSLVHVDKEWNRPERYGDALKTIKKHGIEISTEMILGLDGDTNTVFADTFEFLMENKIALPRLYILTPVPGTRMYFDMKDDNRIFDFDFVKYNGGAAVYRPKNMTAEELEKGYWNLYRKLYSVRNLYKRMSGVSPKIGYKMKLFLLATNLHYRNHLMNYITPGIV